MLKDAIARLSRHTLVYALAGQASKLLSFAFIPFYTTYLSERDYGVRELLYSMLTVLAIVAGSNMASAMARFYFERPDAEYRNTVVSTALLSVAGSAVLVGGLAALFAAPIGQWIARGYPDMTSLVLVALGILVLQTVREMLFQYLRTENRSTLFTAISLVKLCVELGLMIWFLAGLQLGVIGLFHAMLIGEALALAFMACMVLPVTGLRFSPPLFRAMALFVLPLIPTGLAQFWLHSGDRFMLQEVTDNEQVGIYGLAYSFGTVPNHALLAPFMMVWFPWVFSLTDDELRRKLIGRLTPYFMFAMTACCLVVSLFAREAVVLMARKPGFHVAWPAVPLICAGYWCWSFFKLVETGFYVVKRTDKLPVLTGVAVAINVVANLVLMPGMGFLGAAWATLITFALLVVMGVRAARPVFAVDWPWRRVLMPVLSAAALCAAAWLVDLTPGAASIGLKCAAIAAWLCWMWAGGFLRADERQAAAGALSALLARRRAHAR